MNKKRLYEANKKSMTAGFGIDVKVTKARVLTLDIIGNEQFKMILFFDFSFVKKTNCREEANEFIHSNVRN